MKLLLRIWFVLLLGLSASLHAQKQDPSKSQEPTIIKFERIGLEQGLSQITVQCLLQDRRGFIWLGTQDGLNQYDGYSFKVYKLEPGNLRSLSENTIEAIYEDRAGILWIGTQNGGLNQFDPATETFRRYQHDPQNPQSLSSNNILTIYQSSGWDDALWIGTDKGLNQFDRATGTCRRYQHDPENPAACPTIRLAPSMKIVWVSSGLEQLAAGFVGWIGMPEYFDLINTIPSSREACLVMWSMRYVKTKPGGFGSEPAMAFLV